MVRAIRNHGKHPAGQHPAGQGVSTFTPIRATETLPLVRRIIDDVIRLNRSIESQKAQIAGIDQLSETIDQPTYRDEVSDIRESLNGDIGELQTCLDELALIGIQLHQPFEGYVDFPALLGRRPVCLCWQPTDERVEYWHELGQSPRDRKKWDASVIASQTSC